MHGDVGPRCRENKKGVESLHVLTAIAGYHTLASNKHKRPTPHRDVSARLILRCIESGSFDSENKRRISKFPVAQCLEAKGYVISYFRKKGGAPSSGA